jgi:ubiquinone biosynthesis protein
VPELARYHPVHIIEEFELVLLRELDFVAEASATARFEEAFQGDDAVRIPHVHWELISPRVLTLGRLSGQNLDTVNYEGPPPVDRHLLARRLVNIYLKQFFDMRLYHADPHPGNILITAPAHIGLIDFGQVGMLSDDTATSLVIMLLGLVYREAEIVVEVLADLGAVEPGTDTRMLTRAMRQMLDKYHGLPLKRLDLPGIFNELARITRDYGVTLPRETVMVLKTLVTIAGVALKLDPELDLVALFTPRIKGLISKQFEPRRILRSAGVSVWHILSMLKAAPAQLRSGFRLLGSGKWQVHLRHENIDQLTNEIDRSSNRMAFAVVIAGVIIGSSMLIGSSTEFTVFHVKAQWIGVVGYAFAGLLGVSLLWAIWRSGRLS